MAVVETAEIRLEGDTSDFQTSFTSVLATIAKVTAAAAATTAGVVALGKAFRSPGEAMADVSKLGTKAAATFTAVGTEAGAAFTKISSGAPILTTLGKALAIIGTQLGVLLRSLGTTAKAWLDDGMAAMGFTKQLEESRKALQATGEAVDDVSEKTKENGKLWGALGAILGQTILSAVSKLAQTFSDLLNPELSGVAANVGAVSAASLKLQRTMVDLATAFESGRQRAILPLENALSTLVPTVGEVGKAMAEVTGEFSAYASATLKVVSVGTGWAATLAGIGAGLGALKGALDIGPVRTYAEKLLGVDNIAKGLTGVLRGLATLIKTGLKSAFEEISTTLEVGFKLALNPWTAAIGIAAVAVTGIIVQIIRARAETALLAEAQEKASRHFRDARDEITAYAQDVKNLSKIEGDFTLSIKAAVEQLSLQTENLKAQTASAQGLGVLASQFRRQAEAIQDSVQWQQRRQMLEDAEKNISREVFETRKGILDTAEREYNLQKLIADQLTATRETVEATNAAIDRRNVAQALAFQQEQHALDRRQAGLTTERQLLEGFVALGASREQTEAQFLKLQERDEDLQRKMLEHRVEEAKHARAVAVEKAAAATSAEKLIRFVGMSLHLAEDLTTEAKRYTEEWKAAVDQLTLFNSGLSEAVRQQQALSVQWGTVEETIQQMRDTTEKDFEANRTRIQGELSLIQAEAQAFAAKRAGQAETEASLRVQTGFLEAMRGKRLELNAAERDYLRSQQAVANEERNQINVLLPDAEAKLHQNDILLASLQTRLKANATEAKVIATELIKITDVQHFALSAEQLDKRLALERASLQITQEKFAVQEDALNAQGEIVGLITNENDRSRAQIQLEQQHLELRRQLAIATRASTNVELGFQEQQLANLQKLDVTNQKRIDDEPVLRKQIDLTTARLGVQDAELQGMITSAEVLRKRFEDVGTTVIDIGNPVAELFSNIADATTHGITDLKGIYDSFGETIVSTFRNAFANALAEKLRFDLKFKTNFLEDLPNVARQGVGLIGKAFSALGGMGGDGTQGSGILGSIGQALSKFGAGGTGDTTGGAGGTTGGGSTGGTGNIFSTGLSVIGGVQKVASLFGSGLGGGTAAGGVTGGIEGLGVVAPELFTGAAATGGADIAGGILGNVGVLAQGGELGGVAAQTVATPVATSAVSGIGTALASTGIGAAVAAAVIGILASIQTIFAASKARYSLFGQEGSDKFVAKQFDSPLLSLLGTLSTRALSFGVVGGKQGYEGVSDLVNRGKFSKEALFGILANPLEPAIALAAKPPPEGASARHSIEDFIEGPDANVPFFRSDSGTFAKGAGQQQIRTIQDSPEGRAFEAAGGDSFQWAAQKEVSGVGKEIGLTTKQVEDATGAMVGFYSLLAKEHPGFDVTEHVLGGVAALFENIKKKSVGADDTLAVIAKFAANLPPLDDLLVVVNNQFRDGQLDVDNYKLALQGLSDLTMTDLPAGVDAGKEALRVYSEQVEKFGKDATVTASQIRAGIKDASLAAQTLSPGIETAFQAGTMGRNKASSLQSVKDTVADSFKETLAGSVSTLLQSTVLDSSPLTGFFERVRGILKEAQGKDLSISDAIDQIHAEGQKALADLEGFGPALDAAYEAGAKLRDVLGEVRKTTAQWTAGFTEALAQSFGTTLSESLKAAFGAPSLSEGLAGLRTALGSVVKDAVTTALVSSITESTAIKTMMAPLQDILAGALGELASGGISEETIDKVKAAIASTGGDIQKLIAAIMPLFDAAYKGLSEVRQSMSELLQAGFANALSQGLAAALSAPNLATGLAGLREAFGNVVKEAVVSALVSGIMESTAVKAALAPLQDILASALGKVQAGGLTKETLAEVQAAVASTGTEIQALVAVIMPLLDAAFKGFTDVKKSLDDLKTGFAQTLTEGLAETLRNGLTAAFGAATVEEGMKGIATSLGSFVQQSVSGALIQALLQSSVIQTAIAPLQTVLAAGMAEAVAGGITAGTLSGVAIAAAQTAAAFKVMLTNLKPLFAAVFESLGDIGSIFGGPSIAQRQQQDTLQKRLTSLQREEELVQRTAQTRINALEKELAISRQFKAIQDSAQRVIEQIQGSAAGGLTPFEQLELTQKRLDAALADFRKPGATPEERSKSADRILELIPTLLSQGGDAFQPQSDRYRQLRDFALQIANEVRQVGADNSKNVAAQEKELADINKRLANAIDGPNGLNARIQKTNDALRDLNDTIQRQAGTITPSPSGIPVEAMTSPANLAAISQMISGLSPTGATVTRLGSLANVTDITSGAQVTANAIDAARAMGLSGAALQAEISKTLDLFHTIQNLFPNLGTNANVFRGIILDLIHSIKDPNFKSPYGFKEGGVVPGPYGKPHLVIAHGGEQFLGLPSPPPSPRFQPWRGGRGGWGGGGTIQYHAEVHNTINVPPGAKIDEERLARRVNALAMAGVEESLKHGRMQRVVRHHVMGMR